MPPIRANDQACTEINDKLVEEFIAKGFYHSIELPDGRVLEGILRIDHMKSRLAAMPIPADLAGKRALDIGTWDGFFAFELEKRGAEVTAIDKVEVENFRMVRELLGSRADYRVMDVYELSPERMGYFDVVLFLGVLYHLKHPLLGLERVCQITREMAIVESFVTDEAAGQNGKASLPTMEFYENGELLGQVDNWTGPNVACLLAFCRTAGFARVELLEVKAQRALVACYRHWTPEPGNPEEEQPRLNAAAHTVNYGLNFDSSKDEYIAAFFKSSVPALNTDTVMPEVGGYGIRPAAVVRHDADGWQANFRLPPGLAPGWHPVRLRTSGSRYSEPVRIAVDMPPEARELRIAGVSDGITWAPNEAELGPETWISVWVAGLPENADRSNVQVHLGGAKMRVQYVQPDAEHGLHQVNAKLAQPLAPGSYQIVASIGGVQSAPAPICLK